MGRQKIYMLEILNLDTGIKIKHSLENSELVYNELLEILESYNPEIDFDNLVVYYYTSSKWIILLEDILNIEEHETEWQDKESDQILLKVKYHCFYLLDDEEEKRFNDDVKIMNEKIGEVHDLYTDLKEKYKQQALDINIFWGSPLFAADKLQRNKKPMQIVTNSEGQEQQLLINQVKYAPYVNAVTTALQTCDKTKVNLELNLLNDRSFNQRNVFTVVYLMAHLEIQEIKDNSKNKPYRKPQNNFKKKNEKKQKGVKYVLKNREPQPQLKKTESEPLKIEVVEIPLKKQRSLANSSQQFQMIIEENQTTDYEVTINFEPNMTQAEEFEIPFDQHDIDQTTTIELPKVKKQKKKKINEAEDVTVQQFAEYEENKDEENQDIYYEKDYKSRTKSYKYYFLGEEVNGKLCKITPKKLKSIIKSRISRNIELLILHTSYPYYHLQELKDLANNIILINSNPLVPEPSTIYFIKQFFIHLLKTGNIEQTYEHSITDLNKLKQISLSSKNSALLKEFDEKDIKFIHDINEKYVHGNLECCCCFHKHHERCHNRRNTSPSKYAQYHYKYHAGQCQCLQQNLMIHNCEGKKSIMTEHYDILDQKNYLDNEFYYCCCMGYDLGFYDRPVRNTDLSQLISLNEEKDPHSIKFKYKHEKMMLNQEDNQLEISEGKVTGDCSKEVIHAFKYIQENPLLGNAPLIIKLFEIFTRQLQQCSLDIIRRSNRNEMYMLCNLHGQKSTGRKTIATYFANLLLLKKLCKRIIIKVFNNVATIRSIIQSSLRESQGRPFFIFIHQDKNNRFEKNQLHLKQLDFGQPISAIIITEQPVLIDSSIIMDYIQPIPFNNDNCQHYIKKYKHLSFQAKNNIKTLFHYGTKGYQNNDKFQIYPFSLNQFEILNIVRKTDFCEFRNFTAALDRLNKDFIEYYIFIVYMIKFTNSPSHQKRINLSEIENKLIDMKQKRSLFFKKFDENLKSSNEESPNLLTHLDIKKLYNELTNVNQIRDNFYLIFTSTGYKMKKKLSTIVKLFINYTTIIPSNKLNQDSKLKRNSNFLRVKYTPFFKQVYEATTINPTSYINRYFDEEILEIYRSYSQNREPQTQDMYDFESFINFHADLFSNRKNISRKLTFQTHSKPKEKCKTEHYSVDQISREISRSNSSYYQSAEENEEPIDIPHLYHIASVMEGGLQYIRNVVCTHFIYNRLTEVEKIQLLKYSMLLINNCIILLKNKKFYDISEQYDIEVTSQQNRQSTYTQKFFFSTHSSQNLDSPDLKTRKSEEGYEFPPPNSRTYSGRDILNQSRQYTLQQSSGKSFVSNHQDDKQSSACDELLLKELHRLSTYKGLLFLLDQIQRRSEEFSSENIVQIKICVQLLAIQIRLQQLQLDKESTKIIVHPLNRDRHLNRISQIFNEKNYNISILYRILREQINLGRFNRDIEELGLVKSHIIVSLSLMASRYGKFKIAKAKAMIREIDSFLNEWNQIPFQRRQSQQDQNRNNKKEELLNVRQLSSQYGFLKMICENEYVYIHILEAFTSEKFWLREARKNDEIEIYKDLLRIYHHFALKNTRTKPEYCAKLENIIQKLRFFKRRRETANLSTYIQNFVEFFIKLLENQFKKLKSSLIAIFNADDGRDYVKTSLHEQLESVLKKNTNQKEFFNIKKKFNPATLNELENNCGCKYLCIFTSIGEKNSKEQILIETAEGRSDIVSKTQIVQQISAISSSAVFICLPRKKMLAESIIKTNRFRRSIIYFDFEFNNFTRESPSSSDHIAIFQKRIMIETVKQLIEGIIQKENEGFKTGLYMALNDCKNSLSFALKSKEGMVILRLINSEFRKCLFIEEEDNFYQRSLPQKEISFYQTQRVNKNQIDSLQKIIKKMAIRKDKSSFEKVEEFKIDDFYNIYHFIEIFSFYFRDKYAFDHIFHINFETWRQDKSNSIIKKFLEKLTDEKILDFIFSRKKGAIIKYFEPESYSLYSESLKNCESQLKNIISNIDQSDGKRVVSKFIGYTNIKGKKIQHIIIYILQCEDNERI